MENPSPPSEDPESSKEPWIAIDFRRVGDKLGLQSSRTSQRVYQIDRVRAKGVGDHVALHQLVSIYMTATIIPHLSRGDVERRRLASFRVEPQDCAELPGIIETAGQPMGFTVSEDQTNAPAFAADILRLISENEGDMQLVSDLVGSYLETSRIIVLAVVLESSDVDLQGIRIITKPDLINVGTEQRVARLAKNKDRTKLKLGFFLLKNLAPAVLREGLSPAARKRTEQAFFFSEPWRGLGPFPSRVGIGNLRVFLPDLLDSHIGRELPTVREELRAILEQNSQDLAALGTERNSADQIRTYLT
ncbi:dynamin GTPase [Penicillium sp. IBT 18751x]|nr:dynamin GTPase [Penicillium sp. IBT 18751x]KAJ6118000.1 dynamin GTPase [Penicillium sp. IBT 18751x]